MEMSVDRRTVISAFAARQWHLRRASAELVSPVGFDNATSGTRFAESYCRNVQRRFYVHYDLQFLTTEDSMSDDVFEMDDDRSSTITNVVSGGLTPASIERPFEKTPSPTGYRDYKPPAEVLSNNYSTTFKTTSDFDSVRSSLKKDQERDDNFAHKLVQQDPSNIDDRDGFANPTTLHGTSVLRSHFYDGFVTDRVPSFTLPSRLRAVPRYTRPRVRIRFSVLTVHIGIQPLYIHSATLREFIPERNANTINNNGSLNFEHDESYENPRESRDTTSKCQVQNDAPGAPARPSMYHSTCVIATLVFYPAVLALALIFSRARRGTLETHISISCHNHYCLTTMVVFVIQRSFACMVCLQTILLGDSGVGKTSLLVQFDTGRFQPGNFAATVGIGFTVSNTAIPRYLIKVFQLDEITECNESLSVLFYEVRFSESTFICI
ncbi:Ras-related protein Rab-26 [Cyphomyrmex costatus]|uniref:Ras-related protein Rab-26 n=1 Tax=Cyphomyrmex costatus TaxID=456900 RepID=A0A195CQP4_9HYME|nr:Ras-related protein Rab-26 [Cyphomyrmex costatus]